MLIYKPLMCFFPNSMHDKPTPQMMCDCYTLSRHPCFLSWNCRNSVFYVFLHFEWQVCLVSAHSVSAKTAAVTRTQLETLLGCSSQQHVLLSRDSPVTTSYTSINREGGFMPHNELHPCMAHPSRVSFLLVPPVSAELLSYPLPIKFFELLLD